MKLIRSLFITLSLMLTFAVSGAMEFVGHDDCHDVAAATTNPDDCDCVCVCCNATSAPVPTPEHLRSIPHSSLLMAVATTCDADAGRLLESFIFTPPRA